MKIIFSIAIGIAVFFGIGISIAELTKSEKMGVFLGILFGVIAIYISFQKFNGISAKESIANALAYAKTTTEEISSLVEDKDSKFYAIAEQEIIDNVIDAGLWSQSLVKAKGNENLRKVEYMKLRVKQLRKINKGKK